MGRVAAVLILWAVAECLGCAKPPQAPLNAVVPVIGLPPIPIDNTRPGLDVREMPTAEMMAAAERTMRVPAAVASAMLERRPVKMEYPAIARERHLEGYVLFRAIIARTGVVEGLSVAEASDPVFVRIATASVQSWQYRPYVVNGRTVAMDTMIRVDFSLAE